MKFKFFNWSKFLNYVTTYNPKEHADLQSNTILKDMLYGLGTAISKDYEFADGFKKFKNDLKPLINEGGNQEDSVLSPISLSFSEIEQRLLKSSAKSEYKQAAIVMIRNIFSEYGD